jgi:hypothetical protein
MPSNLQLPFLSNHILRWVLEKIMAAKEKSPRAGQKNNSISAIACICRESKCVLAAANKKGSLSALRLPINCLF